MKMVIEINMDNAAFDDKNIELERIFRKIILREFESHNIFDIDGNKVGSLEIYE